MSAVTGMQKAMNIVQRYGIESLVSLSFYPNGDVSMLVYEAKELAKIGGEIKVEANNGPNYATHLSVEVDGVVVHVYTDERAGVAS